MENKSERLEVAIRAAREAGKIVARHFETEILKEIKEDTSITTEADKEAEGVIKKIILESFPDHSIDGEETGLTQNGDLYMWHVDPIDGTRNYCNGIPIFAVSISLVSEGEILLGLVYNPITNSLFYAEKGKGAYLNDVKINVSKDAAERCIVTVASGKNPLDLKLRRNLMHDLPGSLVSSVRDFGCTALDLAWVARGGIEADIKFGLKIYDAAAGLLLVKEAGGKVTFTDGSPWKLEHEGSFVASNGVFHDILVEEIKRQKEKLNIN